MFLRATSALAVVAMLTGSMVISCTGDPLSTTGSGGNGSNAPPSKAMGQWTPTTQDDCTAAFHDTYFVVGPDGKKYPTWHPPQATDPTTGKLCSFGHDHGLNPSDSPLWPDLQRQFGYDANLNGTLDDNELTVSGVPFGLASEQLVNSTTPRLEDHTGYKIAYTTASRALISGGIAASFDLTCDLFAAYNQPTSTDGAFGSNMFSVIYAMNCNQGASLPQYPVKVIVSTMAVYGTPGSITLDTNNTQLPTGFAADPATSPAGGTELGRMVPTSEAVFAGAFVPSGQTSTFTPLSERWETQLRLRRSDNSEVATLNPAFVVTDTARYFDQGSSQLAHSIDLCYSGLDASGTPVNDPSKASTIVRQVRGSPMCTAIAPNGPFTQAGDRLAFDNPNSPFKDCKRTASFGADVVRNSTGGPTLWYTDAFGGNASPTFFANSIKQYVAQTDTGSIVLAAATASLPSCQSVLVHVPN
ncbi:MAG TPA: hypothetical protein VLW55_21185 [Burkholderiaceae bacterium]|nr:hypothetical protein [Burkholderiaceae bacterium]